MTQRRKAELELQLWQHRLPGTKDKAKWLAEQLGEEEHTVDLRTRLIGVGDAAGPIWLRVDKDMTLATGAKLVLDAKKLSARSGISLSRALERTTAEYDALPCVSYLGNKIVRKKVPRRQGGVEEAPSSTVDPSVTVEEDSLPPVNQEDDRNFWSRMAQLISDHIDSRMGASFDGIERGDIKRDVLRELRTVAESARVRIHLKSSRRKARVTFSDVLEACQVLMMDPPLRGKMPDVELAKKRKRSLAKEYHPDQNNEMNNAQLQAVIEAFNIIEGYHEQLAQSEELGKRRGINGDADE